MADSKYDVQNSQIGTLLGWINSGEIGLPELQRPFVWPSTKVRDLIDSLFNGFPIGYIITWNNPSIRLKDGSISVGKKIVIDGQQRLTALATALSGQKIIDRRFKRRRISIAFNPLTREFQTANALLQKDKRWISDIAEVFADDFSSFNLITAYSQANDCPPDEVARAIDDLKRITSYGVGNISLSGALTIDQVTEIFNRINSQGTRLSTADFIMSKMSADTLHQGNIQRKMVEYFTNLQADASALSGIQESDPKFAQSAAMQKIAWIVSENTTLYQPAFGDIFHVILGSHFGRGKHADLVALISGRDFETKKYTETAMAAAYSKLGEGIDDFVNQSDFRRFIMILESLGMISGKLQFNGTAFLNAGYMLFLILKGQNGIPQSVRESLVKQWIIMSALTGRYSGSSETQMEQDSHLFHRADVVAAVEKEIADALPETYWTIQLPNNLATQSTQNNGWRIFQMAQVHNQTVAWLEKDVTVRTVISQEGNIHHIFPKAYLRKHGAQQNEINQIANYCWLTQPRNLQISDLAPERYMKDPAVTEFSTAKGLAENAIPVDIVNGNFSTYPDFLNQRRQLMATVIAEYFSRLKPSAVPGQS
ncbi:DUF262 domain-containing protein (plasmid) [Lactiplantibacillus plantarum]|uniref:GmrSD restriction endonuclease domain-containing protein n=1 Tax=Lactiplantibacillus plantarum TaxID=1590 RepID=UPI000FF35B22|nr:DUF262 domain-containing protein [Lactiplantibacillus plantarum]QAS31530.1 DUF262 domain-containing protein [Lactiplantibacillus plantarum]RWZ42738.1 DUF262 domain-containing protein [Lactiplantibacillus plantarum]